MKRTICSPLLIAVFMTLLILPTAPPAFGLSDAYKGNIYDAGRLKPTDSALKVRVGQKAPDFSLPDQKGRVRTLASLLARGALLLTFHRGTW